MRPSIGRIVHYKLSEEDAAQINRRRITRENIAQNIKAGLWPLGAQAHIGHVAERGDVLPMIITRVEDAMNVNGQVFLDGNDTLFVAVVGEGENIEGCWQWPVIER